MPPIAMTTVLDGPWTGRSAVLCDLDGCLIAGDLVLPGVPALLATCGARLWVVSNNSTDTADSLSRRLARMDLAVPTDRIVLAGEETLRTLARRHQGARVALFMAPQLAELALDLGLVPCTERPEVAVLARDTSFTLDRLARLAALVHRGVPLQITNPDLCHPGPDGMPVPETGALLAALAAIAPPGKITCLGKPAPDLLMLALARADATASEAVYLGDTPETDGLAARAAGVEFVQIARPRAALVPVDAEVVA
jgi:pyridoxal phosphatase